MRACVRACAGEVIAQTGRHREYQIEWSDGTTSIRQSTHMFGSFTAQRRLEVNDHVLAAKNNADIFMPATVREIMADNSLVVEYCDSTIRFGSEQIS